MRSQKTKNSIFVSILFTTIPAVTAQIGGTDTFSTQSLEELIVGTVNAITLVQVDTLPHVAILIGVFAVFYFTEKNIIYGVFNRIEEKIGQGVTYGNDETVGYKGLAAAIAFVTVQGFAFVIGLWGTMLMGVIGFLIVLVSHFGILSGTAEGMIPGSSEGEPRPDGGTETRRGSGGGSNHSTEVSNQIGDMEQNLEQMQEAINDLQNETKDAENTGNDEEARDAGEKTEEVLGGIKNIELKLGEVLNVEEQDLENSLKEAQEVIEEEKKEQQGLKSIQGRYSRVNRTLKALVDGCQKALRNNQKLTNDGKLQSAGISGGGWSYADVDKHGYDQRAAGLKNVTKDLEDGLETVQNLVQIEEDEQQKVRDEFQTMKNEAYNFIAAYKLIKEVKKEIEELENEDKELEKVAEKLGDKKLMKIIEKEESQELKLEEELEELMDKEDKIKNELETALEIIEEEIELDKKGIKELKQELSETQEIESYLATFSGGELSQKIWNDGTQANVYDYISRSEEALKGIENGLSQIEKRKENETKMLQELENDLTEALNSV